MKPMIWLTALRRRHHHEQAEQQDRQGKCEVLARQWIGRFRALSMTTIESAVSPTPKSKVGPMPTTQSRSPVDAEPDHDAVQWRRNDDALEHEGDQSLEHRDAVHLNVSLPSHRGGEHHACSAKTLSSANIRSW